VSEHDVRRYLVMQGYDYVSYEDFGRRFFEVAVTEERVGAAFAAIAGNEFDMEPMAQGPGKIAKVSAKVSIKKPQVSRNVADSITFDIHIPLLIDLLLDLRLDKQRFRVDGDIALTATARRTTVADRRRRQATAVGYHCARLVENPPWRSFAHHRWR
jgi:hypothetical protein